MVHQPHQGGNYQVNSEFMCIWFFWWSSYHHGNTLVLPWYFHHGKNHRNTKSTFLIFFLKIISSDLSYYIYISRQNMTRGVGVYGFSHFWHVGNYRRLFWVTRRFLRAIKIATESWECVLSDKKVWSTGVDLLGNISIVFSLAHAQISFLATLQKVMVEVYKVLYTRIRDIRLVYYRSGHL